MSFKAKIFIEGQERNILNASIMYSKFIDVNGKPTTDAMGQSINVSIESTGNDDFFYHNMFSPTSKCKGEIIFYKRDGLSTLFKMEFSNAQITGLSEHFNAINNMPLYLNLVISWGIMRMRNIIFEKPWDFNNPFLKGAAPTVIKNNDPNFLGYHLEDLNHNKITKEEVDINEEFIIIIKTEYSIGESISIDLEDISKDYEYNGEYMKNDIIKNISITGDITRVKIKAVKQQN